MEPSRGSIGQEVMGLGKADSGVRGTVVLSGGGEGEGRREEGGEGEGGGEEGGGGAGGDGGGGGADGREITVDYIIDPSSALPPGGGVPAQHPGLGLSTQARGDALREAFGSHAPFKINYATFDDPGNRQMADWVHGVTARPIRHAISGTVRFPLLLLF
jgi:hypothetical protein